MPYVIQHADAGFHSEMEWKVKTDVESSDSSDDSGDETSNEASG